MKGRSCDDKSHLFISSVTFENIVMFGAMITITRIVAPLGVVAVTHFAITAEMLYPLTELYPWTEYR